MQRARHRLAGVQRLAAAHRDDHVGVEPAGLRAQPSMVSGVRSPSTISGIARTAGGAQRLDARAQDGMHGAVDHQRGAAAEEGGLPAQGVQCVGALYVAAGSAEDRQHAVSYLRGAGGR